MKSQIVMVHKDGLTKPHFCCGHCGKVIEDAGKVLLVWNPDKPNETTIICEADKCDRQQGGRYSMELDVAWFYLKSNSGINEKRTREKATALAAIGA